MTSLKQRLSQVVISERDICTYPLPDDLEDGRFPLTTAWYAFYKATQKFYESGDFKKAKISAILSLALYSHKNDTEVFNPYSTPCPYTQIFLELNSVNPEEFTLISQFVTQARFHPFLTCRLLDFCWVCLAKKPKNLLTKLFETTQALFELQGFRTHEFASCIHRTLFLLVRTKNYPLADKIIKNVLSLITNASVHNHFFPIFLAKALRLNRVQYDRQTVISGLEQCADLYLAQNDPFDIEKAFRFLMEARKHIAPNTDEYDRVTQKAAETTSVRGDVDASALIQTYHWQNALSLLRDIPKQRRSPSVLKQMRHLDRKIRENNCHTKEEQSCVSASIDVSEEIHQAESFTTGVPGEEAFNRFISTELPISLRTLETEVRNNETQKLLHFLTDHVLMDEFGNKTKKIPCLNTQGENTELVKYMMVSSLKLHCAYFSIVKILPQLRILNNEHRFSLQFFRNKMETSYLVPSSRKEEFARALYAGMNEDFFTAIHLLAPQVEHMCRMITKEILHESTIIRDAQGLENELSLNGLIEIPTLRKFLTEPIAFYIETIFCRPDGGNLRNKVAHGTLCVNNTLDPILAFAWWFILRFLVIYKIGPTSDLSSPK